MTKIFDILFYYILYSVSFSQFCIKQEMCPLDTDAPAIAKFFYIGNCH